MRILWILISFVILISLWSCTEQMQSKKVVKNEIEMLYGPTSVEELYFDYPEWKEIQESYQPDTTVIRALTQIEGKFEVKIFYATWCSDSRRELPVYFKIIKIAELNSIISTSMWAVDRKLKLDNGLAQDHNIERVATFIFYQHGKEIGRIIESPEALLIEQDIYTILSGVSK